MILGALVLGGGMQACREEEQNRILRHEPGVYQGREDAPLAPEQVDELRHRAGYQRI